MIRTCWLYATGLFSVAYLPLLPTVTVALVLGCVALCWLARRWRWRNCGWLLLGLCHGVLWSQWQLAHRLPVALDGSDVAVIGVVSQLPQVDPRRTRFTLDIESLEPADGGVMAVPLQRLQLSWYGGDSPDLGERWQLQVRLRAGRGFANPGGSDYRAWLLGEGISATGYVRNHTDNQRLAAARTGSVARWRQSIARALAARHDDPAVAGFMKALVLGETSGIPTAQWQALATTGTVHLMVVSGLHVGMVAGVCLLLGLMVGRVSSALGAELPAPQLAAAAAVAGALGYALIAGNGLSLQRALLMTLAATAAVLVRRRSTVWQAFALALLGVALVDPVAVLRSGFWLSFGAVGGLLLWFAPRPLTAGSRRFAPWQRLWQAQLVVFFALLGLLLLFQGSVSAAAPLVNLIAIPWVSLIIVPLCLLGVVFLWLPSLASLLWDFAAWQLAWLVAAVDYGATFAESLSWRPVSAGRLSFSLGLLTAALLLALPRAVASRVPALLLLLGLWFARPAAPPLLELSVLDVGQGLAVVVRGGGRTLVYDTGPQYSDTFNAGSGIVAPYLRYLGVDNIDLLVISHGHSDHAGGAKALTELLPPRQVRTGVGMTVALDGEKPCRVGQQWQWGEVVIDTLWPVAQEDEALSSNDGSCVLHLRWREVDILLPGDIEGYAEQYLVKGPRPAGQGGDKAVDVVVAPHHGSRTSSSTAFVRWVNPRHVVFSAGFGHHFGHPHAEVVARYRQHGSQLWHSAESGALIFRWSDSDAAPQVSEYRLRRWRPWWQRDNA